MIDEKLKAYLKYWLDKGRSKEEISKELINAGHDLGKIEQHFNHIERENLVKINRLLKYVLAIFIITSLFLAYFIFVVYAEKFRFKSYDQLATEAKQLCEDKKFDKAFKNLQEALEISKVQSKAYGIFGYCYLLQNNSQEAVIMLTEALKRSSVESLYFYRLGVAYCNINDANLGIANLRRSIEMNPTNPDYYEGIIQCYLKSGNEDEANKYLNTLNEIKSKTNSTNK